MGDGERRSSDLPVTGFRLCRKLRAPTQGQARPLLKTAHQRSFVVRVEGLEPPRLAAPEPKSGASTNFATPARFDRAGPSPPAVARCIAKLVCGCERKNHPEPIAKRGLDATGAKICASGDKSFGT